VAQGELLPIGPWKRGLNLTARPEMLELDELAQAINVLIDDQGGLRPRPGYNTTLPAFPDHTFHPDLDAKNFSHIAAVLPPITYTGPTTISGGNNWIVNQDSVTQGLYFVPIADDVAYESIKAGAHWTNGFLVFGQSTNLLYVTVRDDDAGVLEITTDTSPFTVVTLTVWNPTSGNTTTKFPKARVGAKIYERIFVANGADITPKNRLYFSEPGLPKTWETNNFIDIGNTNKDIHAISFFADQIIVFFQDEIYSIQGKDFEGLGLEVTRISDRLGTASPDSVVEYGGVLFFVDPKQGLHGFDGSAFHDASRSIWRRGVVDLASGRRYLADLTQLWGFGQLLVMTVFHSDAVLDPPYTTTSFVYNVNNGAWTQWNIPIGRTAPWVSSEMIRGHRNATAITNSLADPSRPLQATQVFGNRGIAMLAYEFSTDEGTAFTMEARTGWIQPVGGFNKHRIRQLEFRQIDSDIDTILNVYKDFDLTTAAAGPITLDASPGEEDGILIRTHAANGFRWRNMMLKLTATSSSSQSWGLDGISAEITALPRRRGE